MLKARKSIADRCPGGFSALLADVIPTELVASLAGSRRRRSFPGEVTFWAFLFQTLAEDRSCARAVAEVQAWRRGQRLRQASADTSSYCKARQRLPLAMLHAIRDHLCGAPLHRDCSGSDTSPRPSTAATCGCPKTRSPSRSPRPEDGLWFSGPAFGALVNLCNGAWEHFQTSVMIVHDH